MQWEGSAGGNRYSVLMLLLWMSGLRMDGNTREQARCFEIVDGYDSAFLTVPLRWRCTMRKLGSLCQASAIQSTAPPAATNAATNAAALFRPQPDFGDHLQQFSFSSRLLREWDLLPDTNICCSYCQAL